MLDAFKIAGSLSMRRPALPSLRVPQPLLVRQLAFVWPHVEQQATSAPSNIDAEWRKTGAPGLS